MHNLSEQSIAEMAPNEKALLEGRGLLKSGKLRNLTKSHDGTLVFGQCQGSGKSPYEVSMDLLTGSDRPTLRCSCPSRQFPCKHQLGLMLAFVANGSAFSVKDPPQELLDKRSKLVERTGKKATDPASDAAPREGAPGEAAAPRKVNKGAQVKKAREQTEALDTLETLIVDLVSSGLGGLTAKSIKALDTQAKRMTDANIWGASEALQHLSALVSGNGDEDGGDEGGKTAARGLSSERQARIAALVTRLWVTVRKGRKALEGKLEEGATQSESDAQVESLLGRRWQLAELKEAGYQVTNRTLLELAHERADDPILDLASATGFLLDLADGSIARDWTSLPTRALKYEKLRSSRSGVLTLQEAALYPGDLVNRRIRWDEKQPNTVSERPRAAADYAAVHRHAQPLEALLKALRNQLKNPLNPGEAVALLAVQRFGLAGDVLVAEDSAGARISFRDPQDAPFKTTRNLRYVAAAFGPGSLALRLWFHPGERAVFGQGLALFVGDKHLRLGM